jgi:hypothetical protein
LGIHWVLLADDAEMYRTVPTVANARLGILTASGNGFCDV